MSIDLQNLNEQLRQLNPPQLRDRLIFEGVVVKRRGQCEVAAEHGVSQPRVAQILSEVGEWLGRVLPQTVEESSPASQLALGTYVAEARIEFLLEQAMRAFEEGRRDKVTHKEGVRGEVQWTETSTMSNQVGKVGFLNTAIRLSLARARLAGVDTSGRTQRAMVMAEARGQGSRVRGQESEVRQAAKAKKSLIRKSGKTDVAAEAVPPQVQAKQEDKSLPCTPEQFKETVCKHLINQLRSDPGCAGWTDLQFREYAEKLWEDRERQERQKQEGNAAETISLDAAKLQKLRRKRDNRHSPQERRREFLASLAAG